MFDASFLNEYHYFAATFSFNDGEFPDTIRDDASDRHFDFQTTIASGLDTLPELQSLVNVETSGLMNVMHTATHHSLTSSNLATPYDTVGGTHDITHQLPTTPGGDLDPGLDFSFDTSPTTYTAGCNESMTALSDDWFHAATSDIYSSPSETNSSEPTDVDDSWVPQDVYQIGFQDENGDWRCSYAACRSLAVFERACDLRKHHSTHAKTFFCPRPECASSGTGFAYPKDYRRHLRSHKPSIPCPYALCGRLFSRLDNMVSSPRPFKHPSGDIVLFSSSGLFYELFTNDYTNAEEPLQQDAFAEEEHSICSTVP
ncbi:C2H2 type zinc finger domain-containing protein [Colletotrichum melonis]|uniref:C2H2 type zinc finger domain-containing protein n=1 Tax=Colletotrichum melonis TaxID=1209925 RepID=A0AAI9Y1Y5_9PEZI|nr:C2H2 type zinc finger domain-containing protein [Colletotrichum melonis]